MSDEIEVGVETEARPETSVTEYVPTEGLDVGSLLHVAIERDGAVDVIEKLVALRNDEMDRAAKRDFQVAFAKFHAECPPIPRDTPGKELAARDGSGVTTLMFSGLETTQRVANPHLAANDFSYSFTVPKATENGLLVECELWHASGFSRSSQMFVPISTIPKATKSQMWAGARTTGKRLALSDVLGITTEDSGLSDGGEGLPVVTEEQKAVLRELISKKGINIDHVLSFAEVASLADVKAAQFGLLKRFLETRKDPEAE